MNSLLLTNQNTPSTEEVICEKFEKLLGYSFNNRPMAERIVNLPQLAPEGYKDVLQAMRGELSAQKDTWDFGSRVFRERMEAIDPVPITRARSILGYNRCSLRGITVKEAEANALFDNLTLLITEATKKKQIVQQLRAGQITPQQAREQLDWDKRNPTEDVEPKPTEAITVNFAREIVPQVIADVADYLAYTAGRKETDVRHLIVATQLCGMVIGKRFTFQNYYYSTEYYLNLWVAWLSKSGENKSGNLNLAQDLIDGIVKTEAEFSCTWQAFIGHHGTSYSGKLEYDQKWVADQQAAFVEKNSKNLFVDEFASFIETMIPPQNQREYAARVCRLYEKQPQFFPKTSTQGYKGIFDPCISFLVTSQEGSWNELMRGSVLEVAGLTNRWIPLSGDVKIRGWQQEQAVSKVKCIEQLQNLLNWVEYYAGSTVYTSCDKVNQWDFIEQAVKRIKARPEFADIHSERLDAMASKSVVQAAKLAGVVGIVDAFEKDDPNLISDGKRLNINCDEFFPKLFHLVLSFQTTSVNLETALTENAEMLNRITLLIKRKGIASSRDVYKSLKLKKYEADGLLTMLLAGGQIEKAKMRNSKAKDLWKLSK